MIGELVEVNDWDSRANKRRTTAQNTYFTERFGITVHIFFDILFTLFVRFKVFSQFIGYYFFPFAFLFVYIFLVN